MIKLKTISESIQESFGKVKKGGMHKKLGIPAGDKISDHYKDGKALASHLLSANNGDKKKTSSELSFAANQGKSPDPIFHKALSALKEMNEAKATKVKVDKSSFKPIGVMWKDWKESWNAKDMNKQAKLVPGGEWVELETGDDSNLMVCVNKEMKRKLPKGDGLSIMSGFGDLFWDEKKKDFVCVVSYKDGTEKAIHYAKGKGINEIEKMMDEE
jgi:hypothetical protein